MDKLEQAITDVELGLRIAKGTDCGLFKTSVKSAKQMLELLKGYRSAIEVIEHLIEGRSKPLESESDREDMDFYHGTGTADRRDSKIAGMMIALDIINDTLKDGEQE